MSIGTDQPENKWDVFAAGASWAMKELAARRQATDSELLALGITVLLAEKVRGAGNTYRFGVQDVALATGGVDQSGGVRKALRKLKTVAMAALGLHPRATPPLPLDLGGGVHLVVEGHKGRRLQSEISVSTLTSLPAWLYENGPQDRIMDHENGPQDRIWECENSPVDRNLSVTPLENGREARFLGGSDPENGPEGRHLDSSTPRTSTTTTPTVPTREGGQEGGGLSESQEALFQCLKAHMGLKQAREAAKRCPDAGDADRLQVLLEGMPLLITHLAELARNKKIDTASGILAYRIGNGDAYRDILDLRCRVGRMKPVEVPARAAAPAPRVPQPECAPEALGAWEAVRGALLKSLPEASFRQWILPLVCLGLSFEAETSVLEVGAPSDMVYLWVTQQLDEELQEAITRSGVVGSVEIQHPDEWFTKTKKVAP